MTGAPGLMSPISGDTIYTGLGPSVWFAKFANTASKIQFLANFGGPTTPFMRQDYSLQENDAIPYTIYKDGVQLASGNFPLFSLRPYESSLTENLGSLAVAAAGNYEARVDFPYKVKSQSMLGRVRATFNNGLADPNPPAIQRLSFFNASARSEVYYANLPNRLEFELNAVGGTISQASADYSADGVNFTPLTVTSSGSVYNADIPALSGLSKISLRIGGTDSSGNSLSYTFELPALGDSTPLTVAITAPADGAFVPVSAAVISANASSSFEVTGVQFKLDGANLGAEDTTAPYSLSWNATLDSLGAHTLTAVARDAAGNTTTSAAISVNVVQDTTLPIVSISTPATGAMVAFRLVTVSALASDNFAVNGVQFKLDGTDLGAEDTTAPYSIIWDPRLTPNGTYALTAVARDSTNVATSSPVIVTVDRVAPVITGVAAGPIHASSAVISWTTDEASHTEVNYQKNGELSWHRIFYSSPLVTSHSLTIKFLAAGTLYNYYVRSHDAAGNYSQSAIYTFTTTSSSATDTTSPAVALTAPAGGALLSGSAVTVSANASDNIGVAGVQFKLDGANLGAEDTSAPYSLSWNTTLAANGAHTLTAVARDAAGNTTTSAAVTVTVDNVAPAISGVAASSINSSAATIGWTTNEPSNSQVEYGLSTAYSQQSALNGTLLTSHSMGLSGLAEGTLYHYRVRSRDQAGNLALSGDFTFSTPAAPDTTPPAAAILSPASGANVKQNVSVSVSASDNLAVNRIDLWADGALAKTQALSPAVPSATVSLAWRASTKGQHTLQAKAYDAAGNSGASALVTVNVTGKMSAVSLVGAGGQALGDGSKTLLLSLQEAQGGAALAFSEDIKKATLSDLRGNSIKTQSRQNNAPMLMSLRPASGGGLGMPGGVYVILMTNDAGDHLPPQSMVLVK